MLLRAIFFDAGNTLVFPDRSRTLAPLLARGVEPTQEQLFAAERVARKRRDQAAAAGNSKLRDHEYWSIYYNELFVALGDDFKARFLLTPHDRSSLMEELVRESHRSSNWTYVVNGTREILLELKPTYRLGVISNSDGHMGELIARVGLGDCFERVTDSGNIGVEKPDRQIFEAAAQEMQVAPADCLYVGDVYSIDYLGAKSAGFDAILFDVCGAYREDGFARVESLQDLQRWLANR